MRICLYSPSPLFAIINRGLLYSRTLKMEEEEEVLRREFAWLMDTEYQVKVQAIEKLMHELNGRYSSVLQPSTGGEHRPILLTAPNQGDGIFCTAAVEGDKIVKAEMNLKLPGRSSKPLRTAIKEHSPWKLKQVQDSANYFSQAQKKLKEIKSCHPVGPSQIKVAFQELVSWLRCAEDVLLLPPSISAYNIYTSEQKNQLKPDIPEDVAIHFHISATMLVLTILSIVPLSRQQAAIPKQPIGSQSSSWLGATFEYGSSNYEVGGQMQMKSQVPWLSTVVKSLQDTLQITQDIIDKVKVFEGHQQNAQETTS